MVLNLLKKSIILSIKLFIYLRFSFEEMLNGLPLDIRQMTDTQSQDYVWPQQVHIEKKQFYLPYCMRLKIKDITDISYKDATALVHGTLLINIIFQGLKASHRQIDQLRLAVASRLIMQIKGCQQLKLQQDKDIQIHVGKRYEDMKITVRRGFKVAISQKHSRIFYSPFQKLVLIASFNLHKIIVATDKKELQIFFNSMEFNADSICQIIKQNKVQCVPKKDRKSWISYLSFFKSEDKTVPIVKPKQILKYWKIKKESVRLYCQQLRLSSEMDATYGDYKMSTRIMAVQSSDKSFYQDQAHLFTSPNKQQKEPAKNCEFTHFCFVLYQNPIASVLNTLLPIFFLSFLSLTIFFQQHTPIERIGIVGTLILGFIGLVPVFRDQLIDKFNFSAIYVINYFLTLSCMLPIIDRFHPINIIGDNVADHYTFWNLLFCNRLFVIDLIIKVSCLLFVVIGLCFEFKYQQTLTAPSFFWHQPETEEQVSYEEYVGKSLLEMSAQEKKKIPDYFKLRDILKIPTKYEERYNYCWKTNFKNKKKQE